MIEMLLLLFAVKYRDGFLQDEPERVDYLDRCMDDYGGIDFEPPVRERPKLTVVK